MKTTAIAKALMMALVVGAWGPANAQTINLNTGAVPNDLRLVLASELPTNATYYSLWCRLPPMPFNYYAGRTDVSYYMSPSLGANTVFIDDPATAWAMAAPALAGAMDVSGPPVPPSGGGSGGGTNNFPCGDPLRPPYGIGWSNLWLEIILDTNNVGYADLILHGATNTFLVGTNAYPYFYQFYSKTNLGVPGGWALGEVRQAVGPDTNDIWFAPIICTNPPAPPATFFSTTGAVSEVWITLDRYLSSHAIEPSSRYGTDFTDAFFDVKRLGSTAADLPVLYSMSGTATNFTDYGDAGGSRL